MSTEQPEHQRTLLIVEDDAAFARTLGRLFERRGYQVRHADSLDVLREVLSEQTPDYAVVISSSKAAPPVWPACRPCASTTRKP